MLSVMAEKEKKNRNADLSETMDMEMISCFVPHVPKFSTKILYFHILTPHKFSTYVLRVLISLQCILGAPRSNSGQSQRKNQNPVRGGQPAKQFRFSNDDGRESPCMVQ